MTHRLEEVADRLSSQVASLREAVNKQSGSNNVNTVRVQGMGNLWNGIALGLPLGATLAGLIWIAWVANNVQVSVRQAEAYRAAVYVVAPRFSEQVEKELERQKERENE